MILSRFAAWFMGSALGRWVGLALLILGGFSLAVWRIDRNAVRRTLAEERARAAADADRRRQAGRTAAQEAQDRLRAGESPQSIVDGNSKAWRRR